MNTIKPGENLRKSPLRGSVFPFFMTFAPSRRKTDFMLILRLENARRRRQSRELNHNRWRL